MCGVQAQQEQLKLLSADLERRKANLQQAQEDLGKAMEQYEDEVSRGGRNQSGCCEKQPWCFLRPRMHLAGLQERQR